MKLHSHKFVGEFSDGSRCYIKVRRSGIVRAKWNKTPSLEIINEYRAWRTQVLDTLFPGKCVVVLEG